MAEQAGATTRPVVLEVAYPERLSRLQVVLKLLFGWLYVGIPHGVVLYVYGILVGLVTIVAFFAILFTGRYPKGLYGFVVGYYRWQIRVSVYLTLLRDGYPPFTGKP